MMLDDLATYAAAEGFGTVGTDLFKGSLPGAPDEAIALREYGGPPHDYTLGATTAIEHARVQAVVRGAADDYATPRQTAQSLHDALDLVEVDLSGTRYHRIVPLSEPFPLERDQQGRWVFAFNLAIARED